MTEGAVCYSVIQLLDGLLDDGNTVTKLLLSDDQRRCEADNVGASGLREQTVVSHLHAEIHRSLAFDAFDDHRIQQALASDSIDHSWELGLEPIELLSKQLALSFGVVGELLIN